MKHLYQKEVADEIISRVHKLNPDTQHQWGKMEVDQMLAHCCIGFQSAMGEVNPPRVFIGRLIGPFFKSSFIGEKPMQKNSPTSARFIISDRRDFNTEKENLIKLIKKYNETGEKGCTTHPHAFFGKLTPEEWARLQYKHLDHHLSQFGV